MTTLKDDLIAARDLIATGWCQIASAQNASGQRVEPSDPSAISFCSIGAVTKVCGSATPRYFAATHWVSDTIGIPIISFNDTKDRTQAEVLEAFDKAISAI